ncbi:MBL fold metallo-hydrolase [Bradyrhizobium barranii]
MSSLSAFGQSCGTTPLDVQILGSGGPRMNPTRASSSYLVWIEGRARILIDMGGGAQHRFGESQAKLEDLWMVGISHLHPDHVSDLPAFLWLSHEVRKEPLKVFGPTGNDAAPDFAIFLNRLFDEKTGAFPVLGSTLGGSYGGSGVRPDIGRVVAGGVRLDVGVIDAVKGDPSVVLQREGTTVTARKIPHGNMPTLAYRVQTGNVSIVFSSDQNGTDPGFVEFAKGANLLTCILQSRPVRMFPCTQHRQSSGALPKRLRSSSSSSVISVCLNSMPPSLICEPPTTGHSSLEQTCSVRQCCETHGPSLVDVRLWPIADLPDRFSRGLLLTQS